MSDKNVVACSNKLVQNLSHNFSGVIGQTSVDEGKRNDGKEEMRNVTTYIR